MQYATATATEYATDAKGAAESAMAWACAAATHACHMDSAWAIGRAVEAASAARRAMNYAAKAQAAADAAQSITAGSVGKLVLVRDAAKAALGAERALGVVCSIVIDISDVKDASSDLDRILSAAGVAHYEA